jgi:carboxyvinyl-carboxyphosphonate phosphorylmutase
MSVNAARKRFRQYLAGSRCLQPASVYDPISARIAEHLGFEVAMFAGSVASLTVLGDPDLILVTLTEFAEQARRITRAAGLPLLVDADHGYGNALNVRRTVQELEAAGVSALTIEDTDLPQPFGASKPRLIPIAEGVGKIRAALDGRSDPDLVIVGRTSAASISGIEDAVARCKAYEAAGADAVFLTGIKQRGELEAVCSALKIPVMLGVIAKDIDDLDYLGRTGVRIGLQGHLPIMAAIQATHDTMKALREGTAPSALGGVAPELFKMATHEADYHEAIGKWLTGK